MNAATGQPLDGIPHVRQSVRDVLTTRVGTRVGRRTYGSELPALVDRPLTQATLMDIYAATATAIAAWEPRLRLSKVRAAPSATAGRVVLELTGEYVLTGDDVAMAVEIGAAT